MGKVMWEEKRITEVLKKHKVYEVDLLTDLLEFVQEAYIRDLQRFSLSVGVPTSKVTATLKATPQKVQTPTTKQLRKTTLPPLNRPPTELPPNYKIPKSHPQPATNFSKFERLKSEKQFVSVILKTDFVADIPINRMDDQFIARIRKVCNTESLLVVSTNTLVAGLLKLGYKMKGGAHDAAKTKSHARTTRKSTAHGK